MENEKKDKKKKEPEKPQRVELYIDGKRTRLVLANPADRKIRDKMTAMKIAQTHIEIQGLTVDPKKACSIADEFIKWLEKP